MPIFTSLLKFRQRKAARYELDAHGRVEMGHFLAEELGHTALLALAAVSTLALPMFWAEEFGAHSVPFITLACVCALAVLFIT